MTTPEYRVEFSSRRRRLALTLDRLTGELVVKAPLGARPGEIEQIIVKYSPWIERRKREFAANHNSELGLEIGKKVRFEGQFYQLLEDRQIGPVAKVYGDYILVNSAETEKIRASLIHFYHTEALRRLPELAQKMAATVGLHFAGISINGARTRWGSCSRKGKLNFSWRLMMAPPEAISSVVAHELAHLLVFDHSEEFYRELERIYPDYRKHNRLLKKSGADYGFL